jgi:ferric-dicitrate binding protein FerR (iron transport regulator)
VPETLATISPGLLAMLRTGDEAAIERIYRANYRALLDAAVRELGNETHAARVVERTAADLWKAHSQVDSAESFDRLLAALLHERIVQEQVRMATRHRLAGKPRDGLRATAPSADVSWEHVKALLHPAPPPKVLEKMQQESRHLAAEHFAAAVGRQRRSYWPIILGTISVLGIVALFVVTRGDGTDKALSSPDARTISAKAGQRGTFTLGDGTIATMGSVSTVTIPPGFPTRLRTVALEGTASFAVAPNVRPGFVVRTDRATITAGGTTFDVSAYPAEALQTVRVREGTVQVATGKHTMVLHAGDAAVIESSGVLRDATAPELGETLRWLDGRIEITDRSLKDALPIIRRWYDIDMRPADARLLDRRVTLSIGLDSAPEAIRALEAEASVKLVYEKNSPILRDAAAAGSRKSRR